MMINRVISHYIVSAVFIVFQVSADRWGRPYIYKRTQNGFMLFSMGPDGAEGTEDDVY
ncbi:MAG TPA: type II secretion system protein GspG [Thermodesulfovibrionia bacterium]|nr:type II secretion system protein GspG [Thermodesulfovibrionia bacterium]